MSFSWLSWIIGPPRFGAIIGVVAAHFSQKRKRVTFLLSDTDDLTLPLRQQSHDVVEFKIAR